MTWVSFLLVLLQQIAEVGHNRGAGADGGPSDWMANEAKCELLYRDSREPSLDILSGGERRTIDALVVSPHPHLIVRCFTQTADSRQSVCPCVCYGVSLSFASLGGPHKAEFPCDP